MQQTLWLIDATALPQVQSEQLYLSHLYIHDMDIGDRIAVKHMQLDASMQIESYGIIQAKRADSICVTWDRHFKAKKMACVCALWSNMESHRAALDGSSLD